MDNFVCADLDKFELFTRNWLDFEWQGLRDFTFIANVTPGYEEYAYNTYIRSCYSYPYFEPSSS